MTRISARDAAFSVAAAAVGAWAMYKTQAVSKDTFEPILPACTSPDEAPSDYELIPYDARLGLGLFGPFVCLITQFLHKLTEHSPAGMIGWVSTFLAALPAGVLMTAEGGRSGAWGIVRYPTLVGLLSQLLGISVVFPLLWVPGCILFGSRDGAILPRRMYVGTLLNIPAWMLTYGVFGLDVSSDLWRQCAGALGGPVLPLFSLVLWGMHVPEGVATDPKAKAAGSRAVAHAYVAAFVMGLAGWAVVVKAANEAYGLDVFSMWDEIWTNADGAVAFMTIDAGILYVGVVIIVAWRNVADGIAALAMTPLLGPGAACALVLWGRERLEGASEATAMAKEKKSS